MTPLREDYVLQVARQELGHLWFDLVELRKLHDVTGRTLISVQRFDLIALRIVSLSRAVGPTPWREVPLPLIKDGTYVRIYQMAGIEHPPVDWGEVYEGGPDASLPIAGSR